MRDLGKMANSRKKLAWLRRKRSSVYRPKSDEPSRTWRRKIKWSVLAARAVESSLGNILIRVNHPLGRSTWLFVLLWFGRMSRLWKKPFPQSASKRCLMCSILRKSDHTWFNKRKKNGRWALKRLFKPFSWGTRVVERMVNSFRFVHCVERPLPEWASFMHNMVSPDAAVNSAPCSEIFLPAYRHGQHVDQFRYPRKIESEEEEKARIMSLYPDLFADVTIETIEDAGAGSSACAPVDHWSACAAAALPSPWCNPRLIPGTQPAVGRMAPDISEFSACAAETPEERLAAEALALARARAAIPEEGIVISTAGRLPRDPIFDEDNESEPYNEFEWDGRFETASEARIEIMEENHCTNNLNRMREQVMRRRLPLPITGMPTPKRAPMNMHPDRRGRIIMDTGCWECGANPVSFWNLPLLSNGAFAWYDDRPICSLMCLNDYVEAKSGVDLTLRSRQDRPEPVSNQCFLNHPRYERWHRPPLAATWTFQR